jgi:hypothetical protein
MEFCNQPRKVLRYLPILVALLTLSASLVAQSLPPANIGQWSTTETWPSLAVHAHLLTNGKVLYWPQFDQGDNPEIYDPIANTFTPVTPAGFNIFCSGHTILPNGQVFVAGGHIKIEEGLKQAAVYDPAGNNWTQLPNMNDGRWYPTATSLPNGDVLVLGGDVTQFHGTNVVPQIWEAVPQKWRYLNGALLSVANYARMFVAPNGLLFNAGPTVGSSYLDISGAGHWTMVGKTQYPDSRDYGSAVMYAPGKVLIMGGDDPPTNTAETIDLNSSSPAWSFTNPMAGPRRQLNATILPDGTVLVTGGSSGKGFNNTKSPVYIAELWNPDTSAWTTLASSTAFRGYHSTAVLLPDGRVLTAGGSTASETSGELFSPPYLFSGTRPTITSAPARVAYGQTFSVTTPDAASIKKVTWVRLSSVTHAFNANQRFNQLDFKQVSGGLNVTAPAVPTLAPLGQYMLFIINGNGVPSVASVVQMIAAAPTVVSINPSSGSTNGATPVTISGTNFLPGATVLIGPLMATDVQVTNSTTITALTPAHSPMVEDVKVTNPDYQASTLSGAYTYMVGSGIAFVQVAFRTSSSTSSIAPQFPLPQRAGDLNIVVVGWNDATSTITSVTDSSGNSYALAAPLVTGTNLRQAIYYAKNIAAVHANTVTVNFNQLAKLVDVRILEYAGLDTVNPLDASNGSSGTGLTATSGPFTTTAANDLVLGADTAKSHTLSTGPGYTPVVFTRYGNIVEQLIARKKGTFNPSANLAQPNPWVMQGVSFKAAGQ